MGRTFPADGAETGSPLVMLEGDETEGFRLNENCWGTYMHGILDNPVVLNDLAKDFGVSAVTDFNYRDFKQRQYDLLADKVREAVDMDYVYSTLCE